MGVASFECEPVVQQAWKSVREGKDLVAQIPTLERWADTVLPPALARTKESDLKLLVISSPKSLLALSEWITHWTQALGISACIGKEELLAAFNASGVQCVITSPADAASAVAKLKGSDAEIQLLLVLAWVHDSADQVDELRTSLENLDPPNQVIFLVDEWDAATRALASDILDTPAELTLNNETLVNTLAPNGFLAACSRDACTAQGSPPNGFVEDATNNVAPLPVEEAKLLSKYMANIVCRSTNRDFRQAVLTMLTKVQKSSSVIEEEQSKQHSLDEFEDEQLRVGIEALMIAHQELAYQSQQIKSTSQKKRTLQADSFQTKRQSIPKTKTVKRSITADLESDSERSDSADCDW